MSAASQSRTNKLSTAQLHDVLGRCDLSAEAMAAIAGLDDVSGVAGALANAGFLIEASRVFAHALPKREAVWWACMCATHTAPPALNEPDRQARELAENWVRAQSDETRRAAMEAAKLAGFQTPEAWAGSAAFWSGDSIAALGAPKVAAPPQMTGIAVAGAVALAAVRGDAGLQKQRLGLFLGSAQDIAAGGPGRLPGETA
jgi:hypothetical protein